MAYRGPERRGAGIQQDRPADYASEYAFIVRIAEEWPREKQASMLRLLLRNLPADEHTWGAIDAFADLLGALEPP